MHYLRDNLNIILWQLTKHPVEMIPCPNLKVLGTQDNSDPKREQAIYVVIIFMGRHGIVKTLTACL